MFRASTTRTHVLEAGLHERLELEEPLLDLPAGARRRYFLQQLDDLALARLHVCHVQRLGKRQRRDALETLLQVRLNSARRAGSAECINFAWGLRGRNMELTALLQILSVVQSSVEYLCKRHSFVNDCVIY